MNGPTVEQREDVLRRLKVAAEATDEEAEAILEDELSRIEGMAADDVVLDPAVPLSRGEASDVLAAIEAWVGLASAAVGRVYAPASPWPFHRRAGWSKSVAERLRSMVDRLGDVVAAVARALGASSWSISVGFPSGVEVSLSWDVVVHRVGPA